MWMRKILPVLSFMCSWLAQVVVAPLVRLTNKAAAKIEDIGPPEGILTSLGAFITGAHAWWMLCSLTCMTAFGLAVSSHLGVLSA